MRLFFWSIAISITSITLFSLNLIKRSYTNHHAIFVKNVPEFENSSSNLQVWIGQKYSEITIHTPSSSTIFLGILFGIIPILHVIVFCWIATLNFQKFKKDWLYFKPKFIAIWSLKKRRLFSVLTTLFLISGVIGIFLIIPIILDHNTFTPYEYSNNRLAFGDNNFWDIGDNMSSRGNNWKISFWFLFTSCYCFWLLILLFIIIRGIKSLARWITNEDLKPN